MSSLPFPLRLAAGLVATGIDTVRRLPEELPAIGVRLAGTAAKLALQVRNEITELTIRGDELLAGTPVAQENPTWARFDDDTDQAEPPADAGADGRPDRASGRDVPAAGSADTIVAGYGTLTLGQLRSRLTQLPLSDLRSLLAAEERETRRPAFLTLISNRIATLERTGS